MRKAVKRLLFALAPEWSTALFSARARAHSHRLVRAWGLTRINHALIVHLGRAVRSGPFRGLVLTPMTEAEHLGPFLLGTYESELDPAWEVVLRGRYRQIVDVGAKFGYYAVGLARLYPDATVVAFDTDPWARRALAQVAAANGVANVVIRAFCNARWLRDELRGDAFVISDCEGYEGELFGSWPVPRLASATLLVEVHDTLVPGVTLRVRRALESTHTVHTFTADSPRRHSACDLGFLSEEEARAAQHEVRGPQEWLLCLPRVGANRSLRLAQDGSAGPPAAGSRDG